MTLRWIACLMPGINEENGRKQDLNHTWLKRVFFFFTGDQSSAIPWNYKLRFALHSFIPWVLSSMFSLQVGFLSWEPTLLVSHAMVVVFGVRCAFEDTQNVFGVSSPRELKPKPPTIKITPWPLSDVLDILIFHHRCQCQIFNIFHFYLIEQTRSRWVRSFCRRDLPVWMFFCLKNKWNK